MKEGATEPAKIKASLCYVLYKSRDRDSPCPREFTVYIDKVRWVEECLICESCREPYARQKGLSGCGHAHWQKCRHHGDFIIGNVGI